MGGPPPPARGGMSLYANLLDPKDDSSASISRAPVVFKQPGDSGDGKDGSARRPIDPALRFQPIRRPQAAKPKPKGNTFPKSAPATTPSISSSTTAPSTSTPAAGPNPSAQRSTLADWAATEEDEHLYGTAEKRQRGGRKRKNKNKNKDDRDQHQQTDWDELYDPARPTNVEEYLQSDEKIREVRDWKDVLYAHRRRMEDERSDSDSGSEGEARPGLGNQFAPPPGQFAPPAYGAAVPPPTPPGGETAEEVYARRRALSSHPAAAARSPTPPPPPPPAADSTDGASISRAPVRYQPPPPPDADAMEVDSTDDGAYSPPPAAADAAAAGAGAAPPRENRPGKAGFATRLMAKYGWTRGTGLGAAADGIVNPLRVQVEKRKKRPDSEGGGYAEPGGRGRIVGGKRAKRAGDEGGGEGGKFGGTSEVVLLEGMLEGMEDLEGEVERGLGQEIGEECGEKYGRVERLYIDLEGRQVFIKFTDGVSALRAVNALEGRIFNGNIIAPRFFDTEKFEKGIYH